MKRLALCLLVFLACPTRAEQYTLSHTTTCRVYRLFGEVFDASTMHGEIQFTLTDGKACSSLGTSEWNTTSTRGCFCAPSRSISRSCVPMPPWARYTPLST